MRCTSPQSVLGGTIGFSVLLGTMARRTRVGHAFRSKQEELGRVVQVSVTVVTCTSQSLATPFEMSPKSSELSPVLEATGTGELGEVDKAIRALTFVLSRIRPRLEPATTRKPELQSGVRPYGSTSSASRYPRLWIRRETWTWSIPRLLNSTSFRAPVLRAVAWYQSRRCLEVT